MFDMKATLRCFACWLFCVFGLGCAAAIDQTRLIQVQPYCEYVGRWVELQRPVKVVEHGKEGEPSKQKADYAIVPTNWTRVTVFGVLPAGHKVFVSEVRDETSWDDEEIVAYGRTTLPWSGKDVSFAYSWGWMWTLKRAPWEPDNTPEKRAPPFKLPPHFDYDMFKPPAGTPQWGLSGCSNISTNSQVGAKSAAARPGAIFSGTVPDAPRVGDAARVPDAKW
jgi:hypothetical protein